VRPELLAGRERGGTEGRVLLWRASGCGPRPAAAPLAALAPAEIGAALFRAAGLPQSDELPPPPPLCRWQAPPNVTPTFGVRAEGAGSARSDEYLQNLRSLGYL